MFEFPNGALLPAMMQFCHGRRASGTHVQGHRRIRWYWRLRCSLLHGKRAATSVYAAALWVFIRDIVLVAADGVVANVATRRRCDAKQPAGIQGSDAGRLLPNCRCWNYRKCRVAQRQRTASIVEPAPERTR